MRSRFPFVFVGLVLLATGIGKLLDIPGFAQVIASYQLVPARGELALALVFPFWELCTGAGLLVARGRLRRAATISASLLHALLLGTVVTTLSRGIEVANCGCFGVFFARPLGLSTLAEDAVMLALSLWALVSSRRSAPAQWLRSEAT